MGSDASGGWRARLGTAAAFLVMIAIAWWGLTYIPVIRDVIPSLVSIVPDTRIDITDLPAGDTIPASMTSHACHNIPFLWRPLAGGRADTARIIFTDGGRDLGEIVLDCRAGKIVSDRQY